MWMLLTLLLIGLVGAACKYLPMVIPPVGFRSESCLGLKPKCFINSPKDLEEVLDGIKNDRAYEFAPYWTRIWGWVPDDVDGKRIDVPGPTKFFKDQGISCKEDLDYLVMAQNHIDIKEVQRRCLLYNQWVYTGDFRDDWHLPVIFVPKEFWGNWLTTRGYSTEKWKDKVVIKNIPEVCSPENENVKKDPKGEAEGWHYRTMEELKESAKNERKELLKGTLPFLWNKFPFYDIYWEIIQEYIWHIEPWRPSDEEIVECFIDGIKKENNWKKTEGKFYHKGIYAIKPYGDFAFYHTYYVPPLTDAQKAEVLSLCNRENGHLDVIEKYQKIQEERSERKDKLKRAVAEYKHKYKKEMKEAREKAFEEVESKESTEEDKPNYMM